MKFRSGPSRSALLLLLCLLLGGCFQSPQSPLDEEREPHFQAGKSRMNAMDYQGAIESFEKALEVNPHSASAHYELGYLFDQQESDPAAAIYHYQEYLKLRPKAENADILRQRITTCKQELAATVSLAPVTEKQQRDLEQLTQETKRLQTENQRLQQVIAQWQAYYQAQQAKRTAELASVARAQAEDGSTPALRRTSAMESQGSAQPQPRDAQRSSGLAHVVQPGDTLARIARHYGVSLGALVAANPDVNARRLRPGQTVHLPSEPASHPRPRHRARRR